MDDIELHDLFLSELQETSPEVVPSLVPPYEDTDTLEVKFQSAYESLRRAVRLKSRNPSLVNAYFLGKILSELPTPLLHHQYRNKLTVHYLRMAENTFDLFEFRPEQIMRTRAISATMVRKLQRQTIMALRDVFLDSFSGVQG